MKKQTAVKVDSAVRANNKFQAFAKFALLLGELSVCPKLKVGTIIFAPDYSRIYALGYNGGVKGDDNMCEGGELCCCLHSEVNALLKYQGEPGAELLVTYAPCSYCAKCIINSGIKKVHYLKEYKNMLGLCHLINGNIIIKKHEIAI